MGNFDHTEGTRWFALRVKPRWEKTAARVLQGKGFEEFLPTHKSKRRWSDRIKEVELPLFPGYLFCRMDPRERLPVLTTPGVLEIVGFGKKPAPVDDHEIAAIQSVVNLGFGVTPWPYLRTGNRVEIVCGPLKGLEGIFLEWKQPQRLVVSVTLLQRSVAVEIDPDWVIPLELPVAHLGAATGRLSDSVAKSA